MALSWIARGAASAERARRRMQLLGVTPNGYPVWAGWEEAPLLHLGPSYSIIGPMLERRTTHALYSKAGRLGVTQPRGKPWTDPNEIWRLKIYATGTKAEILAAFPGRTWGAIAHAARKRGYRRPKPQPAPSGIIIIDQILERAAKRGWKLSDLDEVCRTAYYFRRGRWKSKLDPVAVQRAVEVLGGRVRASFPATGGG